VKDGTAEDDLVVEMDFVSDIDTVGLLELLIL